MFNAKTWRGPSISERFLLHLISMFARSLKFHQVTGFCQPDKNRAQERKRRISRVVERKNRGETEFRVEEVAINGVNGIPYKPVAKFKYLGTMMTPDGQLLTEIARRISLSRALLRGFYYILYWWGVFITSYIDVQKRLRDLSRKDINSTEQMILILPLQSRTEVSILIQFLESSPLPSTDINRGERLILREESSLRREKSPHQ